MNRSTTKPTKGLKSTNKTPKIHNKKPKQRKSHQKPLITTTPSRSFTRINKQPHSPTRKLTQTPLHSHFHRKFSSADGTNDDGSVDVFLEDFPSRTIAIDPKDGTINSNPGFITPTNYPKAQHLVSPHLRQFVHHVEGDIAGTTASGSDNATQTTTQPQKPRAPIQPQHLTMGYRYLLKHLKYITDLNRRKVLKAQFRSDFDLLGRCTTLGSAEVQFDRSIPNLWSQLSVVRMGISKLRRPRIPEGLTKVTEYLGAQDGAGYFCAIQSNDERFNKKMGNEGPVKPGVIESRGEKYLEKAKLYNMDLHPADIDRHYELVERFHFNGKERRGGW